MSMKLCMVCEGSPFVGFTFHGPFATDTQAESWAMARPNNGFWWIIHAEAPTLPNDSAMRADIQTTEWVYLRDWCNHHGLSEGYVRDALDKHVTWGERGTHTLVSAYRLREILLDDGLNVDIADPHMMVSME